MSNQHSKYSDNEFVEGLAAGSSAVLNALYKKYFNIVLKFILSNNGSHDSAADVYQETIIVVYQNAQKPGFTLSCQLQTYIYSIAKKLWLKELHKTGNTFLFKEDEESDLVDVREEISDFLKKEEDFGKLYQSLGLLGEPCKTLIEDFYIHKMDMEGIAEKFGYTNSDNAKNQKYKCLQRLKKYFFEKTTTGTQVKSDKS
jgi:RNA polymerase sigma factor (sigma-70 family)